jgi:hypothetical protein
VLFRVRNEFKYFQRSLVHFIVSFLLGIRFYVRSTARHAIHLQFDISTNAFEIRAVQSPECMVQRRALDFRISRQCRPKQSFQTPKW